MSRTHFEQSVGSWSPKLYKWKFWTGNYDAHKMLLVFYYWWLTLKRWTRRRNKSRRMNLSNQNQIQNQDGFGRRRWHHHWKRHYWRRHHKNPHLQEQIEVLEKWTSTTIRGKIMKQPQVGIKEDACLSLAKGKHETRDDQPPATTATANSKLGGSILAPPHPTTSLSNDNNIQLGGEGIPRASR